MWCCQCFLDTYIALLKCKMGALSVSEWPQTRVFEFWHARCPSGVERLAKNLICASASQAYVERIFCMWAAPFWAIKRYVQVFSDNSSDSAERNLLYTPSFRDLVLLCYRLMQKQSRRTELIRRLTAVWWWTKTKMFSELNKIKMIASELYKKWTE